jgi:hypothetical protein
MTPVIASVTASVADNLFALGLSFVVIAYLVCTLVIPERF